MKKIITLVRNVTPLLAHILVQKPRPKIIEGHAFSEQKIKDWGNAVPYAISTGAITNLQNISYENSL